MHIFLCASESLEFFGANDIDDRPFIVMPYLKNGNARNYNLEHPDCDRLQIVWPFVFVLFFFASDGKKYSFITSHWVLCTFTHVTLFTVISKL
jgi:hypothetical protein